MKDNLGIEKPTESAQVTQWKLISESAYWEENKDNFEDANALSQAVEFIITAKSNIPDLTNTLLYYIAESEGIEDSIAEEIAMLQARKARFKKRSDNLRDSIKQVFDRFDIKKMECPYATVSKVTRAASKLNITDEGDLLMNYPQLYVRQEPKLDKAAVRLLLEEGVVIEGVELVDTHTIMIRK